VNDDVGVGEVGPQVVARDVGLYPLRLWVREGRTSPSDPEYRRDVGIVAERVEHTRADVTGGTDYYDPHEMSVER
jgi:hypothetical protein